MKKYDTPWDPEKFLRGDQVTYPYQHSSVIFYRAEPVSSFFGNSSILKKRYIEAANGFYTEGGERGNPEVYTAKSHGVYGGFLETAKFYAEGSKPNPILKLEVPASEVITIYVPPEERSKRGKHGDPETTSLNNLKQMHHEFGSPEKMREVCINSLQDREGFGGYEYLMFMVPHEIPVNENTNRITGIWDNVFYDDPHWESMNEFVQTLKNKHPKGMPDGISSDKTKEEIKQELEVLENLGSSLENLSNSLKFDRAVLKANQISQLDSKHQKYLKNTLNKYDRILKRIYQTIESKMGIKLHKEGMNIESVAQINEASMKNIKRMINSIEDEIRQIEDEERKHAQEIMKETRDPELYKKEAEYEEKVERKVSEDISQLPVFTDLESQL